MRTMTTFKPLGRVARSGGWALGAGAAGCWAACARGAARMARAASAGAISDLTGWSTFNRTSVGRNSLCPILAD